MLSPAALYPILLSWLQAMKVIDHRTAQPVLAHLLTALLTAQSLRPSALMRALSSPLPVPARQRYKRVARAWTRPWLSPAWLTPRLVRAVLALVWPDPVGPTAGRTHLALDSVRCGKWEIFTLGVVWHGRALPVGWAVLPYPWPKRQFTPTVCALLQQVAAAWPADRPAHLIADRAFPSRRLFQTLRALGWGWTVRLRANNWVTVAGQSQAVRTLLAQAKAGRWTVVAGAFGGTTHPIAGTVVIGRGLPVLPRHQRTPGSLRHRARQHAQRERHLRDKRPRRYRQTAATATDRWVVLFTTHSTWSAATTTYRLRWATEGTYRDAQSGWDGKHGWDLEPVVARLTEALQVERVVGLWALGTLVQSWVGHQTALVTAPVHVHALVGQWTTTGRLSVWARGRLALTDPSGLLRDWLRETLQAGAQQVAAAQALPALQRQRRTKPGVPTRKAA